MLTRLTDEEWTVVVTRFSACSRPYLPHGAGMPTGAAEHRWRWEQPALSSAWPR
jgi:hypothetical protein